MKKLFIWLSAFVVTLCMGVLDNIPLTFEMSGQTTYNPDRGGVAQSGYKLRVGYMWKQWLGVQLVGTGNQNDVLIMELDEFYTSGSTSLFTGHQVIVTDYYRTDDTLNLDQNTQYDVSAYNYVDTKSYYVDMIRYMGSSSGEDWNAPTNQYSLIEVCFYSSDDIFDIDTWHQHLKQCYHYEIDNYTSTFKGPKLKTMMWNGYETSIHGWIDGPYVSDNLYFYQEVPLFTYHEDPAIAVQFGTTSGDHGQDFHVFSPVTTESGDYYGDEVTNITMDNTQNGGYENSGFVATFLNTDPAEQISGYSFTTLRINFSRNVTTFDQYDKKLKSTFIFCLYLYAAGTINSDLTDKACQVVELSYHYPRMTIPTKPSFQIGIYLTVLFMIIYLLL